MRVVSRRTFTTASRTAARPLRAVIRSWVLRATQSLRSRASWTQFSPQKLLAAVRTLTRVEYRLRSPLLNGATGAFKSSGGPQQSARAYAKLNTPTIAFSRGGLSGFGPRPSCGPLTLSPLRGGMGLQSARKFSSGGARVFDNLIVNAPLVLRLAGDEAREKAFAGRKPTPRRAVANPRRTGATFSSTKLPRNALLFATKPRQAQMEEEGESEAGNSELSDYFQFPQLPIPTSLPRAEATCDTVITIRLIDSLFEALGGREPYPPAHDPRLFDSAFLLDANTALEHEHRREMRARAILRALWDTGFITGESEMDLDEAVWTVVVRGMEAKEVEEVLRERCGFAFGGWCSFEQIHRGSDVDGLDLSYVDQMQGSPDLGLGLGEFSSPELTPEESVGSRGSAVSEVGSEGMMSLPSSLAWSDDGEEESFDSLYDSRDWS